MEQAISEAFVEQLVLDERDLAELARLIDQRTVQNGRAGGAGATGTDRGACTPPACIGAKLARENAPLAEELLAHAREAKALLAAREADLAVLSANQPISSRAWVLTQRVEWVAQRIRATFIDWSREAKARVIGLALEDSVLGYVNRWDWACGCNGRAAGSHVAKSDCAARETGALEYRGENSARPILPDTDVGCVVQDVPRRSQSSIATYARHSGRAPWDGPFTDAVPVGVARM